LEQARWLTNLDGKVARRAPALAVAGQRIRAARRRSADSPHAVIEAAVEELGVEEIWMRLIENLADRVSGPMKFRMLLQPGMAIAFAVIAGLRDAKLGKPPYAWALLNDPEHRRDMLKDGWKSVGKVFVLAMVLDVIYQIIVLQFVYPGEVLIVALLLAIVPYLLVRGLVTRIARR
jgi:hypothetical protein